MKAKVIFIFIFLAVTGLHAQNADNLPRPVVLTYINTFKSIAISEMKRTGIPASIILAQGILETDAGTSDLVRKSNNHFGIKCKDYWTGPRVFHDDDAKGECFRSYVSPEDSYKDHSDFLKNSPRYASLFNLDPSNFEDWAKGLKKAGYATNRQYSQLLIKIIEDYHLQDYTLIGLNKLKPDEEWIATQNPSIILPDTSLQKFTENLPGRNIALAPAISYPSGQFKINETKVVYAAEGTSLLALAQKYDVSLNHLLDFNDIKNTDILQRGQLIYLQRKRRTGVNEFHIVQPGETLYDISQAEGIRLESLLEYNHLAGGVEPSMGEMLYVKYNRTTHKVQTKETLYGISKKYGVPVEKLMEWNNLNNADLKTGQELIIYKN